MDDPVATSLDTWNSLWEEVKVLGAGSISQCGLVFPSWGNQVLQHPFSSTPAGSVTHPKPLGVQGTEIKRWWLPTLGPEPLGEKARLC